jgi:hypothetical protein
MRLGAGSELAAPAWTGLNVVGSNDVAECLTICKAEGILVRKQKSPLRRPEESEVGQVCTGDAFMNHMMLFFSVLENSIYLSLI